MKKRILSMALVLCMVLTLLPTVALAATMYAKPYFEDPVAGEATPASQLGATAAVSYVYADTSLYGEGNSWFSGGTTPIHFEAVFTALSGIHDYGNVVFNASTAPYITYTPSAEAAGQTVKFKVKATDAEGASVTGAFIWTVNVAAQPTDASSNANLSALRYTVGTGETVVVPGFSADTTEYDVTLPYGTAFTQTATLSGTVEDTGKANITTNTPATIEDYTKSSAKITVTAENGATTKTYTVNFRVAPPDEAPSVYIGSTVYHDGDTINLAVNEEKKLYIANGSGTSGAVSSAYKSSDMDKLYLVGTFEGVYPAVLQSVTLKLAAAGSVDLLISFYDVKMAQQSSAIPTSTMTLHIVADGKAVNVDTAAELTAALQDENIEQINVAGSFTYGSINKTVSINVQSGSILKLQYGYGNTLCNANIAVEQGGKIEFYQSQNITPPYLIFNGSLTIKSGGNATTDRSTSGYLGGGILFLGDFTNNGSYDTTEANTYLKYSTTTGTFTGTPCWNLHIAEATKTSVIDPKLYITGVTGTVAVGGKLHPVLDGFGEMKEAIPGLNFTWGDSNNGGNTFEYTVPATKAGSTITVKVNGSPSNASYAYFLVDGTTVKKVTDTDAGFTTAPVPQLDTVYVGGASKSDSNTGASADKAVATFETAYTLVAEGGTIVVCGTTTGGSSSSWVRADKSITISNTDGTVTFADAQLNWPCIMFSKTVTIKNVKLTNSASQSKQFNLYPLAAAAVANLENISSEGAILVYNQAGTSSLNNSTFNIKNTSNLQLVTEGYTSASYPALNLDHSTVISNNSTAVLGDVSLRNGSTLITTQTINSLISDSSDNAIALFDNNGVPMAATVNGTVTIAEGNPITLLNYTGSKYTAFTAGNLTLLTASVENASLTADKFVTMDTANYGLKKVDNSIVTEKKIIVTFEANGGTCNTVTLTVDEHGKLASLPMPTRSGSYTFDGWYTSETGGTKITTASVFADSTTVYAHWTYTGGNFGGGSTTPTVTVPVSGGEGKVSVSASVSGSTATITVTDQQLAEIASNTAKTGTVTIDLSSLKNVNSTKIPAKFITSVNTATDAGGLEIILPTGTVKLDKTALASMASANKGITVSVEEVKTSSLTAAQKEALGDKIDSAVVVDVNVLVNGTKISDFGGGTITVSFPYMPKIGEDPSNLTIWYIKDDGTIEKMGGHYDSKNKCFVFETTHLSRYVLVSDTRVNPFTDVADRAYYYDSVLWAVSKGMTGGTSATTFSPNAGCTRAQTVTFLWRSMGSPEPTSTVNPFADVSVDAYYYKAVLWAMEKGITSGTSATNFSPDAVCIRSQVVTFLWRAAGKSVVNYAMNFTDVPSDSYYTEAVRWAVSEGIASGTGDKTFSPIATCSRAQIVTFLYRYLG